VHAATAAAEQATGGMLYPELAALSDEGVVKNGRRLDHAEGIMVQNLHPN
jgi:hypothetical protein